MSLSLTQRLSLAAHAELAHANPLSMTQIDRLVAALAERSPATVLDVGCGPGGVSIELARRCDTSIRALDIHPGFLDRARSNAATASLRGRIAFEQRSAEELVDEHVDAVVCIGASHAFGTPAQALARCAAMLKPGGSVLFAELTWTAAPPADFLAFLGVAEADHWPTQETVARAACAGLAVRLHERAPPHAWQRYEDGVRAGRLRFADTLHVAEAAQVRHRADTWLDAYERHGRRCLGFDAVVADAMTG